jgi:PIN domain-containing protein
MPPYKTAFRPFTSKLELSIRLALTGGDLKINFVMVDFENVQPKNVSLLSGGPYKIKVFLGANQSKIPLEMARALQACGPDAEYIQIDGSGKNALDFHIARYIEAKLHFEQPS